MRGSPPDEPRTEEMERSLELVLDTAEGTDAQSRIGKSVELVIDDHRAGIGFFGQVATFGEEDPWSLMV